MIVCWSLKLPQVSTLQNWDKEAQLHKSSDHWHSVCLWLAVWRAFSSYFILHRSPSSPVPAALHSDFSHTYRGFSSKTRQALTARTPTLQAVSTTGTISVTLEYSWQREMLGKEEVLSRRENSFFFSPLGASALWKPIPQDYITLLWYRQVGLSDKQYQGSVCSPGRCRAEM